MKYESFKLLYDLYFERTGESENELKAANILKDECEKFGVSAVIEDFDIDGYKRYLSSALKKGYSGTCTYTKIEPLNVVYGINGKYNDEGRVITLEFDNFFLVNAYVPNSQEGLNR